MFRYLRASWSVLLGLFLVGGLSSQCGGGGCNSCNELSPIPGSYPPEKIIPAGGQVRMTRSGLDFMEANAGSLIADMLPGGLTFPVPPTCDAADIFLIGTIDICGEGSPGNCVADNPPCEISVSIGNLTLTPQDPPGNRLNVNLEAGVVTTNPIQTHDGLSCDIAVDTSQGNVPVATLVIELDFVQDSVSGRTRIVAGSTTLQDFENDDISITGGFSCGAINLFGKGFIIGELESQVSGLVGPMLEDNLCMTCAGGEQCPGNSTCDGQVCQEDSGEGCVMATGIEGRLALGGLVSSISPGNTGGMDMHLWLGAYSRSNNDGLSLGLNAGAASPGHNECVPQRPEPDYTPAPESGELQTNTRPHDGQPYMVGIGLHKKFLDAAGFSLFDSGLLCLTVGPREVPQLAAGTFGLLFPSIFDLTHSSEAPLVLQVKPQHPLVFELGAGTLTQDPATGEYTIVDPLFTITSQDFAIDFYLLADYRYVRIFRLTTDLAIPMALTVNADNQLVPVMGDLTQAFTNVRVSESQLMEEDPATMAALFPTLFGIVAGFLGDLPAFDLPDLSGFQLVLDDGSITSIEGNTLMAIFADLVYVGAGPKPKANRGVGTRVEVVDQYTPDTAAFAVRSLDDYRRGPSVTLDLGAHGDYVPGELEWQYRIDDGVWSPFTDSPRVTLRRPGFFLQGWHHVDVRARVKGDIGSLDRTPERVNFVIDSVAPELDVTRSGRSLTWTAKDLVTPGDLLEFSVYQGGTWGPWRRGLGSVELPADYRGEVRVRVRDEAGNVRTATPVLGIYGRVEVPPTNTGCGGGCNSAGEGAAPTAVLILLAFGLLLWWRRREVGAAPVRRRGGRRRLLPFLAVLVVPLATGAMGCDCGKKTGSAGDRCGDAGVPDLICSNLDLVCPSPQIPGGTTPMTRDPQTCTPVPVLCECVDPPPIDPGDHGRYLSLAARDGQIVFSAYSDRWSDLIVATVDPGSLSYTPESVDGVPSGPITGAPSGYRGGVSGRGPDVGHFTSVAIDSAGAVHVSYKDVETGELKYADNAGGSWEVHTVETLSATAPGEVWYTFLDLDGSDQPRIAYMVNGVPDPSNAMARVGELRYASATSAMPRSIADWTIGVVDRQPHTCAGFCGTDEVCDASSNECVAEDTTCGGCGAGEGCVAGGCVPILEAPAYVDHPEGVGLYVAGGRLTSGNPVLAYHDRAAGTMRVAVHDGSAWTNALVEGDAFTDMGLYCSVAVAADDTIHLSYTDAALDELIYAQLDSTGVLQLREVADDGMRSDGKHVIGLDSRVFIDGGGTVRIVYQDGTTADIFEAVRDPTGPSWSQAPLFEGDPGYGFFIDVATDTNGTTYGINYIYDRAAPSLTRVEVFRL